MANLEPKPLGAAGTALRGDWGLVGTEPSGPWLRATAIEPGPIALRARWHYLRGLGDKPRLRSLHCIDDEQWQLEIDLETEGDLALVRQATDVARARSGSCGRSHPTRSARFRHRSASRMPPGRTTTWPPPTACTARQRHWQPRSASSSGCSTRSVSAGLPGAQVRLGGGEAGDRE